MFALLRTLLGLSCSLGLAGIMAGTASAQDQDPASHWADFNHYVRVARPDLAEAAGIALLKQVDTDQLLNIVESSEYKDYEHTLQRAIQIDTLQHTAQELTKQIQSARIKRSREPARILADIKKLAEGMRAKVNATHRLRAAGQYASPYLLESLLDEDQQKYHSVVLAAMVAVGRPMVYPLSVSLPHLEPVPLGQVVQVLAEIGYPQALPYLKQVLENSRINPTTRSVVQSAYDRLINNTTAGTYATAAQLFLELGWRQYLAKDHGTILSGFDRETDTGLIWEYDREAGLVPIPVPGVIYGDALAMRSAQQALRLSPQMDSALSLWLMANLRRENRLPKGSKDRSYPASMHPPSFYMEMAGPLRQHDVLDRALNDNDADLSLDAIAALASTAGTEALINREGTVQPLLRALAYPDRRVRFNAAFAMTNARPRFSFPGSDLVVPVLAEAVRQSTSRHAVIIGSDRDSLNKLMATARELEYKPIGGLSIDDVMTQVNTSPSVDLIMIEHNAGRVEALYGQASADYRIAAVPILAMVTPLDRMNLSRQLSDHRRLFMIEKTADPQALRLAIEQASQANAGQSLSPEESSRLASTALRLLRGIAASHSHVYNVSDAQPTLIQALSDTRQDIAVQAAGVLSLIDNLQAQRAIADAAMDTSRPNSLRVSVLEHLSESARFYGNYLSDIQLAKLLDLVKTSRGELVKAAAQAHGALTLPTSDVVQLIVE